LSQIFPDRQAERVELVRNHCESVHSLNYIIFPERSKKWK
jgi:hypothetical protein